MTRDDLLAKLRAMAEGGDPEGNHSDADDLLLEYINDAEVKTAYHAIEKWYA